MIIERGTVGIRYTSLISCCAKEIVHSTVISRLVRVIMLWVSMAILEPRTVT